MATTTTPAPPKLASNESIQPNSTTQIWCTGKDSNLRTSLGGTDLQSVGFNHSPTCAALPGDQPLRFIQQAISSGHASPRKARQHTSAFGSLDQSFGLPAQPIRPAKLLPPIRENQDSRSRISREDYTGKVPNGVRWKNLLRRLYRVPAACGEIRFRISHTGAGEGI